MKLSALISKVETAVQDPSFTSDDIKVLINQAVSTVASGVMLPGYVALTPPLPDLYAVKSVLTVAHQGYVNLPDDYDRALVRVFDSSGDPVRIMDSFREFFARYGQGGSGDPHTCVVHGKKLFLRDVPPDVRSLELHFHAKAEPMVEDDDEPTCIPESLQKSLIVGYACREIFELIEDALEGPKKNTRYWDAIFQQGLSDLHLHIEDDGEPEYHGGGDPGDYID